eukprot:5014168-Amphidinium_carterae.1
MESGMKLRNGTKRWYLLLQPTFSLMQEIVNRPFSASSRVGTLALVASSRNLLNQDASLLHPCRYAFGSTIVTNCQSPQNHSRADLTWEASS